MRRLIGIGVGALLLLSAIGSKAQSDVQLSQHMLNRQVYNPAVTGASRYINLAGNIRDQWRGWVGAPRSQILSAHSFFEPIRSGVGLTIIHNELGLENTLIVKALYAYHVQISPNSYLSMGVGGGIFYRYFNSGELFADDPNDPGFELAELDTKTLPDFDFGLEFNTQRFTVGFSVTHFTHATNDKEKLFSGRHFYGFARYQIPLDYNWEIEPAFFMQQVQNLSHIEIGLLSYYRSLLWFGMTYRFNADMKGESVVPLVGAEVTKFLRIGYSYDIHVGGLRRYGNSTHELFVGIRISKDRRSKDGKYRSPRFFE